MSTRSKDEISTKLDTLMEKVEVLTQSKDDLTTKINTLLDKITTMNQLMHQISNVFLNSLQQNLCSEISKLGDNLVEKVNSVSCDINKSIKRGIPEEEWHKKLSQRKFSFYESHRNDSIATIYEQALNDTVPKVPRKFFKNPYPQQSPVERDLQKELMIKEVQHEIKRLHLLSEVKKDFIQRLDHEMISKINNNYESGEAQQQIQKWYEAIEKESNFSKLIWDRRSNFFKSDQHLLSVDGPPKFPRFFNSALTTDSRPNLRPNVGFRNRYNNRYSPPVASRSYNNFTNYSYNSRPSPNVFSQNNFMGFQNRRRFPNRYFNNPRRPNLNFSNMHENSYEVIDQNIRNDFNYSNMPDSNHEINDESFLG